MNFFNELKRRNVFKVGIAYIVGAWLVIQVSDILFESIGTPAWVLQTVFVLLGIRFFVALIFAWAFELTPDGIQREQNVDRSQSITTSTGRKLDFIIIGLLVIIAGYFIWESRFSEDVQETLAEGDNKLAVQADIQNAELTPDKPEISRQSIAVLPFDNRSRLPEDEFFVQGVHDDLLTNLARIGSLKVISRTSVNQYRDTEKTIPSIATELGVATVMEGAVQRAGNTVRINVQLIDAQTDEHLWAEIFDRELTTDNLFSIQSEISEAIADALEATLSPQEQQQINRKPTDNLAAYNAYLLGRQLLPKRTSATMQQAMTEFTRAVELDPDFALAWAAIAEAALLINTYGTATDAETLSIMENAIEHALKLDPLLGEAYAAQGQVYHLNAQNQEAERVFQLAIELSPNYATAYHWYSILLARQPARMAEALVLNRRARELDPLSPVIRVTSAWIYDFLGEFERAEQLYLEAIELNPDYPGASNALAELYADSMGRYDKAARLALNARANDSGSMWIHFNEFRRLTDVGATRLADRVFQRMEDLDRDHVFVTIAGAFKNIGKGNFDAAKEYANSLTAPDQQPRTQWTGGFVRFFAKDYDGARQAMLRAYPGYYDPQQWPRLFEEERSDACIMAWVFIHTGDPSLARDLATNTIVYLEETLPQYIKHADRDSSVACHAVLGDKESMLGSLELMVSHNHIGNWSVFSRFPPLESLLDDPRFIAIEKYVTEELERQRVVIEAMYTEQNTGS